MFGADTVAWPYSVSLLASSLPLVGLCIGPLVLRIWGIFDTSHLEVHILFEQWVGHRLLSEKVTRPHERAHRPISISSVPVSEGIEFRQGCRSISCLVGALGKLPGGSGRFLPCAVGEAYVQVSAFWGGSNVPMGLLQGHWRAVTINASSLSVGF